VKLLGDVKLRRQLENLSKLSKLDGEPSAIGHPSNEPLFLVKEESGVELCDDLLVPIVVELQQISDAMKITSFYNFVEMHILLLSHAINVNPLMLDHRRCLRV
jgi:hypothetical protein